VSDVLEMTRRTSTGRAEPIGNITIPTASQGDGMLVIEFGSGKILYDHLDWHLKLLARLEGGTPFMPVVDPASEQDIEYLRRFVLPEIKRGSAHWVYRQVGDDYVLARLTGTVTGKPNSIAVDIFEGILNKDILCGGLKTVISLRLSGWLEAVSNSAKQYRNLAKSQVKWTKELLLPEVTRFAEATGVKVFLMPGNDDAMPVLKILEKGQTKSVRQVHGKAEPLGDGFFIAGCSFVPWLSETITMRDWILQEGAMVEFLDSITEGIPPAKLILSTHPPPCGVPFSNFFIDEEEQDGGSLAVRAYIERVAPLLTLHGHIHEAPSRTGVWKASLARGSLSINPGALHQRGAEIAIFDLFDVGNADRIVLPLLDDRDAK
jgi:Icc-related predicted phosphoesterase